MPSLAKIAETFSKIKVFLKTNLKDVQFTKNRLVTQHMKLFCQ